jgi:vancomycin resistance protein YoaR
MAEEGKQKAQTENSSTASSRKIPRNVVVALVCIAVLAGMLSGGAAVAQRAYHNRIFGGISIAGVDVSGMTTTNATEAVQHAVNVFLDAGITTSLYNETKTIPLMPRGASDPDLVYELAEVDVAGLVNQAYEMGRLGSDAQQFFMPLWFATFGRTDLNPNISFAETRISDALREAFPHAESPGTPTDFVISFTEKDVNVQVIDAVIGSTIDMDSAFASLQEDAKDLKLGVLSLNLVERSSLISAEEATTLIPAAIIAIKKAPYILTFSNDEGNEFLYEITQKNLAIWLKPEKDENGTPVLSLDSESMTAFLTDMHTDIDIAAQDAKFTVEGDRVTEFVASRDGLVVDDDQLFADVRTAFSAADTSTEPITIAVARKSPNVPIESINTYGIKEILGQGVSSYAGSPSNRRANIRHGAEKLNGLLIAPGETLSLLENLRPFTTEDGYLPELVIKGDEIIPEIGGGLCQIGTTTFRSAMNSGLHIAERRNHSLVVSYYNDPSNGNPGTDATIYDPSPDLKIQNDTNYYIMLETQVDEANSKLTFNFWGTSDGRKGSYTPPQVLSWTGYGEKVTKETTSLAPGTTKCQTAHPGATTTFDYNILWADGTTTTETFDSSYRALPETCLVGIAALSTDTTTTDTTADSSTTADTTEVVPVE